jgi:hypothetical protein
LFSNLAMSLVDSRPDISGHTVSVIGKNIDDEGGSTKSVGLKRRFGKVTSGSFRRALDGPGDVLFAKSTHDMTGENEI